MQNFMNLTELLHEKADKIVIIHCQFYLRVYHIYPIMNAPVPNW